MVTSHLNLWQSQFHKNLFPVFHQYFSFWWKKNKLHFHVAFSKELMWGTQTKMTKLKDAVSLINKTLIFFKIKDRILLFWLEHCTNKTAIISYPLFKKNMQHKLCNENIHIFIHFLISQELRVSVASWLKCWTGALKWVSSNSSRTITFTFGLIPLGKELNLFNPLSYN